MSRRELGAIPSQSCTFIKSNCLAVMPPRLYYAALISQATLYVWERPKNAASDARTSMITSSICHHQQQTAGNSPLAAISACTMDKKTDFGQPSTSNWTITMGRVTTQQDSFVHLNT